MVNERKCQTCLMVISTLSNQNFHRPLLLLWNGPFLKCFLSFFFFSARCSSLKRPNNFCLTLLQNSFSLSLLPAQAGLWEIKSCQLVKLLVTGHLDLWS